MSDGLTLELPGLSERQRRLGLQGFTLIELMLIVTILAIIVAIALPSLLQTRKSANEGAAVAAMRTLSTAELWYRLRNRVYASVPDLVAARCLDDAWETSSGTGTSSTPSSRLTDPPGQPRPSPRSRGHG